MGARGNSSELGPLGSRSGEIKTRDLIIRAASELFERKGYHGTGIAEIIAVSGAPKGSVYYHFPGGKQEIAAESVLYAGSILAARTVEFLKGRKDAASAIKGFVETIAHYVETSGFGSGGPLLIVASETAVGEEKINARCREAYGLLQDSFAERLKEAGLGLQVAKGLAVTITAAVEGGIVLSRTCHSGDPLRRVAKDLGRLVAASLSSVDAAHAAKGART